MKLKEKTQKMLHHGTENDILKNKITIITAFSHSEQVFITRLEFLHFPEPVIKFLDFTYDRSRKILKQHHLRKHLRLKIFLGACACNKLENGILGL